MSDETLTLGSDFSSPSYEQWVAEVEKTLKGAPFDKKMYTKTYEGITLQPVYTRTDWPAEGDPSGFPGAMPYTRGGRTAGHVIDGWDVRQMHVHPDIKTANANILSDLDRGVTSLILRFDHAFQAGLDGDAPEAEGLAGEDGLMVYSAGDLDEVLGEVDLTLVPLSIEVGAQFTAGAALLAALWQRRGVGGDAARGAFNADPLGVLAATGSLPVAIDTALKSVGDLGAYTAKTWPHVTAVRVDTSPYHTASASETQDLGISMATAVAYLKALTDAGLDIDTACRQIVFTYSVGCDFFMSIAKLRAARKLWSRIAEACGASEPARAMNLHGVTAHRMLTQRDPWVNLLRTTASSFAAALGGADAITVKPYDGAIRPPDALGRRLARNTQITLQEESYLTKVIDPAGGSWYIESLTDQLARTAWGNFQEIEKAGGIVAALTGGLIRGWVDGVHKERLANLAKRRDPVTGISEFPNLYENPVTRPPMDMAGYRAATAERLAAVRKAGGQAGADIAAAVKSDTPGQVAAACVEAASQGATVGTLAKALAEPEGAALEPFPQRRLAEPFEALRNAADAYKETSGNWPQIFLANLGRIAQHTARATFSKNFFETGGIQALTNEGFKDSESCVAAFKESGARIAIICGADTQYEEMVPQFASALKAAGCTMLFLAGHPGEKKQIYLDAGVDDFIFLGGNVLETLRKTLAHLGVTES